MSTPAARQVNENMGECIQHCLECHRICLETVTYCLKLGGAQAEAEHINLLLDCAEICRTSADFMIRGSELHQLTCGICAEVCERCAADCEQMRTDDAHLKACAEVCRRCAKSCRQMAQSATAQSET